MREKRFVTAKEIEKEMQAVRNDQNFTDETEAVIVRTMIDTAKSNNRIGDKLLMVVNPLYVHMPSWQRKTDLKRALVIGTEYSKHKWELPKVIYLDGKLWCVDGQHRIYGAYKGMRDSVAVEILDGLTEKEAIELFLGQTKDRRKMTPADVYKAAVAIGDETHLLLREICHRNNIRIKGEDDIVNAVGTLTSISDGLKLANDNPETLDRILKLLTALEWGGGSIASENNVYGAKFLRVFSKLYSYCRNSEWLERTMIENCKGAAFYKSEISDCTQSAMFDRLSEIVSRKAKARFKLVK